jgi:hypothetical protein
MKSIFVIALMRRVIPSSLRGDAYATGKLCATRRIIIEDRA